MAVQNNHFARPLARFILEKRVVGMVRWGLSGLCIGLIIWRLWGGGFAGLAQALSAAGWGQVGLLLGAVGLAAANLGLEAARWRYCLAGLQVRGWRTHLAAVVAGIAAGLPLTHLVGDYSSKLAVAHKQTAEATPLLVASSFAQYLASFAGAMAGVWLLAAGGLLPARVLPLGQGLGLLLALLTIGYTFLPAVYGAVRCSSLPWATRLPATVPWPGLAGLLAISLGRYGVILGQYALVGRLFMPEAPLEIYLAGTALALGIKTLVPFLSVGGMVGLRELLALTVLGSLGFAEAGVVAASLLVWIINVAGPALLGTVVLARPRQKVWWQL